MEIPFKENFGRFEGFQAAEYVIAFLFSVLRDWCSTTRLVSELGEGGAVKRRGTV